MRDDLLEAYLGVFADDLKRAFDVTEFTPVKPDFDEWAVMKAALMIQGAPPKERLDTYLQWNGILGYTSAIFAIATGET